jgi:hypothetical protein
VPGDEATKLMRAVGHADPSTTHGYVREAEGFGSSHGEVFGPLPEELLEPELPDDLPERYGANGHACGIIKGSAVGEAGFEPARKCRVDASYSHLAQDSGATRGPAGLVGCANSVAKCANAGRWDELPGGNEHVDPALAGLAAGVSALVALDGGHDAWLLAANDDDLTYVAGGAL